MAGLCPAFIVHETGGIIVTGASRGLGFEIAKGLDQLGFTVIGTVRNERDAAALKAETSDRCQTVLCDQTKPEMVKSAGEQVEQMMQSRGEKLVGIVCNAGITVMGPTEATDLSVFEDVLQTNVVGAVRMIKTFLPTLRKNKGRIIVIGAPDAPLPQYTYKTMCNGALLNLTRGLRVELADAGVSVSLVMPAGTEGGMAMNMVSKVRAARETYSEEMREVYPEPRLIGNLEAGKVKTFPISCAVKDVCDAMTATRPQTRYTTTPMGSVLWFLTSFLPDRMLEYILSGFAGTRGLSKPEE